MDSHDYPRDKPFSDTTPTGPDRGAATSLARAETNRSDGPAKDSYIPVALVGVRAAAPLACTQVSIRVFQLGSRAEPVDDAIDDDNVVSERDRSISGPVP